MVHSKIIFYLLKDGRIYIYIYVHIYIYICIRNMCICPYMSGRFFLIMKA